MACPPYTSTTYGQALVVTSTTRPTGFDLYEGRIIYETDTDRVLVYDGTNWIILAEPVQGFTPTLTNITVGAGGTNILSYHRSDGFLDFSWTLALGSAPTMGTGPTFSLPVAMSATFPEPQGFPVFIFDNSAGARFYGHSSVSSTTVIVPLVDNSAGTYITANNITATVPMTWAVSDLLYVSGRYQMTTRAS